LKILQILEKGGGMATRRSLNKLEFKAHMSIHNFIEVAEAEMPEAHYTRDRFGQRHRLAGAEASQPAKSRKSLVILLVLFQAFFCGSFSVAAESGHRSTDIQVASTDENLYSLDKKLNPPEEKAVYSQDQLNSVEVGEDGDPHINTKF